jgi:hypothetical protein
VNTVIEWSEALEVAKIGQLGVHSKGISRRPLTNQRHSTKIILAKWIPKEEAEIMNSWNLEVK